MNLIRSLLFRRKLYKLRRAFAKVEVDRDAEACRLKAAEMEEAEAEAAATGLFKAEFRWLGASIEALISDSLVGEAERLGLPRPSGEDYWEQLKYTPHMTLTQEGQELLRGKIRDERRFRREVVNFWFQIITVLLSLLIAILALLK